MADLASSYEQEQERLRASYDGDPEDDLPVDTTVPEVNPEIYRDVEPLLLRGFLHISADINGVPFVFKSLNHHEFAMLGLMSGGQWTTSHKSVQKYYALFMAYGVVMVDGVNILPERDRWVSQITAMFEALDDGPRKKIIRHLSEVNRRASQAVLLTEAFSFDPTSRLRWAQTKGSDLTSTAVTGFMGTNTLGMNWGQLTWRAINNYADLKDQAEREWENAKFVASASAGKGMTKVHNQDKRRREQELQEQIARRDKIIRFALLGEGYEKTLNAGQIQVARTVAELHEQLRRDLSGEKDFHDMVVDSYENQIRDQNRQRAEHLQTLQKSFEEKFGDNRIVGGTDLQGLSPQEVQFQMERRRQLAAQRLSAHVTYPEMMDPKTSEFIEKWSAAKPTLTNRSLSEGSQVTVADRAPGVPFRLNPKK
jgi:hypothetical protein